MVPDSPPHRPRHLAAVWIADVVGFSTLASSNEDEALRRIAAFQEAAESSVQRYGGRVVKYLGDAALAEFPGTDQAVRAAADLRVSVPESLQLRVGIHVGDVMSTDDGDILGDGVNLAARLQTAAEPGQILVSEQAWHQLRHREGFSFVPAGARQLKGQSERLRIWEVIASPSAAALDAASDGQKERARRPKRHALHPNSLLAKLQHRLHGRRLPLMAAAMIAMVILGVGLWQVAGIGRIERGERPSTLLAEGPAPTRLAVLYFDDHSPGGELGYLADGLTEALIHELSQVDALQVISRNGVKPYRDAAVPVDSIVRALGVGSLVEGSVAQSGDRIRVTVQLIDGASGAHLESRVVEEEGDDLFALQDNVVEEVAGALRQSLGREVRLRELRHGTESEEAYELVLRARQLREQYPALRLDSPGDAYGAMETADSLLVEAHARDPAWSEPIILRGWIQRSLAIERSRSGEGGADAFDPPLMLADQALALEPDNAAALELRGRVLHEKSRLVNGLAADSLRAIAEADLTRSTLIAPDRASAWWELSQIRLERADFLEAKRAAQRALAEDVFLEGADEVLHQVYYTALQLGPEPDAQAACNEGRRRYPTADQFVLCQLFILASFPDVEPDVRRGWALADSLTALVAQRNRPIFEAYGKMLVAEVAARAGLVDSARAVIQLARGDDVPAWLAYNEAHARLLMGEKAEATRLLSLYLTAQPDTALLARDWWFSTLREEPGFRRLVGLE